MYKTTMPECAQLLPTVLINYLWQLATESGAKKQTFVLSPKYIGGGEVQDILHRQGGFSSWRRVFGYKPVAATVEVCITGNKAVMCLLCEERTLAAEQRQKEGFPCSA